MRDARIRAACRLPTSTSMARNRIRVLIVDDNAIDRELLNSFLEEQPDFDVLEGKDAEESASDDAVEDTAE